MVPFRKHAAQVAAAIAFACACSAVAVAASGTAGESRSAPGAAQEAASASYYFLVYPKEGRIWAFGDVKNYLMFMEHGEVTLTRTRIGIGPNGETVVFGITAEDVKNNQPSAAELVFDGKVAGAAHFYAEVVKAGRYHVFGEWQDLQDYLAHGEIIYTFTEIGTGPKGETVIYALNRNTSKEGRPVKLIERFQALRAPK
jgi:hypothetical protein